MLGVTMIAARPSDAGGGGLSDGLLRTGLRELDVSVGYAGNLKIPPDPSRSNVRFVTVTPRYGWFETNRWEIMVELPLIISTRPDVRTGIGLSSLARRYFSRQRKFAPFFEIGGGILLTEIRVKEIGGSFQFTPQAGFGFRSHLGKHSDFTLGVRFHHISNAGIRKPNVGINSVLVMVGFSKLF
jgi:hypothetical protein